MDKPAEDLDFILLFGKNVTELGNLVLTAIKSLKHDGLLWISYPKKSSKVKTDISRDVGWDVMSQHGLRPVNQISIDQIWSALRF